MWSIGMRAFCGVRLVNSSIPTALLAHVVGVWANLDTILAYCVRAFEFVVLVTLINFSFWLLKFDLVTRLAIPFNIV
jgi:hypothetical protein